MTTTTLTTTNANGEGLHIYHATWVDNQMSCECGLAKISLTADEKEALIQEMIAQDGGR